MASRWSPIALLLGLVVAAAPAHAGNDEPIPHYLYDITYGQAEHAYERGDWAGAWSLLAALADAGHPAAARWALRMWRQGLALYGQRFEADATRRERWMGFAIGHSSGAPGPAGC